jgi:hypothetical protein
VFLSPEYSTALGHRGWGPALPLHVESLHQFPPRTEMKSSQQFLGLIKFYRWFLPAIAGVVQTLTDAFRGCPRRLVWSSSIAVRFTAAKPQLFRRG